MTEEQKTAIEQFLKGLDDLGGKLENIQTAADLIPQLSALSDLLGKLNAAKDVIDRVNNALNQVKQLVAGGNGPAQLGTAIQLAAGALDAAAQAIPILGPLASYFQTLADAVVAATNAAYKLRDQEGFKNGLGIINTQPCARLITIYNNANGDLDKTYEALIDQTTRQQVMRETPEMRAELKKALLAKLGECCLRWLKVECPTLK